MRIVHISATLFQCEFCGTVYTSEQAFNESACATGEPPRKLQVGDLVMARFDLGAGMEVVGTNYAKGRIVEIYNPGQDQDLQEGEVTLRATSGYRDPNAWISLDVPRNPHDWMCRVEPLDSEEMVSGLGNRCSTVVKMSSLVAVPA